MIATANPHLHAVASTFVIPIAATVLMEMVETIADSTPVDWKDRQIKTGWDLCVLALGTSGAIFTSAEVQKMLGVVYSVDLGIVTLLATMILGLVVAGIRKRTKNHPSGLLGTLALALGGTALVIPWYIVVHT